MKFYIHKNFFQTILTVLFVFSLSGCPVQPAGGNRACFKDHCLFVEIARTPAERMRGLQFRKSLAEGHGMLFIFEEEDFPSFWMKNTFIPLDMIWLDSSGKIVHMEHNVPPCRKDPCPRYTSPESARYVLETNAGYNRTLGLQMGGEIDLYLDR